jgi:hypothetical protein
MHQMGLIMRTRIEVADGVLLGVLHIQKTVLIYLLLKLVVHTLMVCFVYREEKHTGG